MYVSPLFYVQMREFNNLKKVIHIDLALIHYYVESNVITYGNSFSETLKIFSMPQVNRILFFLSMVRFNDCNDA